MNEQQLRKCCDAPKRHKITIDGGPTPDVTVLVCEDHYQNDSICHKFVKNTENLVN